VWPALNDFNNIVNKRKKRKKNLTRSITNENDNARKKQTKMNSLWLDHVKNE